MDDSGALTEIRRAARATLEAWPAARAAVLFGSRARGSHLPDSDWDVAFIVEGDGDSLGMIPEGVPFRDLEVGRYVNDFVIPEKLVVRKARCIGHVGHGITRDGLLLAGDWDRPDVRGRPFMEADRYRKFMHNSVLETGKAIEAAVQAGRSVSDGRSIAFDQADDFVACTADAAEHLSKAMLGRHGIDAKTSHDVKELAAQARKEGYHDLADDIVRMNGWTRQDHVARYNPTRPERLRHATGRLPVVIDLMQKELAFLPKHYADPEKRAELMATAVDAALKGAAKLRDATQSDGSETRLAPSCEWLEPLVRLRLDLPRMLERMAGKVAAVARRDAGQSGNLRRSTDVGRDVSRSPFD